MSDILKMFGLVIKSLFKKSACDMYPFKQPKTYDTTRGAVEIDAPRCILCTMCARKCPTGAIEVDRNGRTWKIDRLKCILCNACVECCPPKCLSMAKAHMAPQTEHNIFVAEVPEKEKPKKEEE